MKEELFVKLKILKLYNELFTKKLSAKDIEKIYIEYLKLKVKLSNKNTNHIKDMGIHRNVTSFDYLLDIDLPECINNKYKKIVSHGIRYNLGFISGQPIAYTDQSKLDNLVADIDTLNIKWFETNLTSPNEHGGYKIALFSDGMDEFYIVRQNIDNSWSMKIDGYSKIVKIDDLKPSKNYYRLVKCLEIVKPIIK